MGFLDRIVEDKRREVAAKRGAVAMDALRSLCRRAPVRDFHAAVSRRGAVIAELKARTPTIASFTQSASLASLAETYAAGGAAAISIVTDATRFGTSLTDVRDVRLNVALPLLAKDFVIDPYQVVEARASGADAVLLIARLLGREDLRAFLDLAHDLGMNALVEAHDEDDVRAAADARARIIGINNRDLDTMTVSLDTTRRLARLAPADAVRVAESGIRARADIDDLMAHGATAFLVGGCLLEAADPGATLRELTTTAARGATNGARVEK